ncbi:AraC-type DNA-binding protein [Formosa sp. Hel1_31_208]|uniref:nickel-binding protein n=1 Tax=Formosa sp. Hel1_31_208 TaxID=1798225 RepID=UPI00087A20BC|nr:nickel-binding protein [Formosa sp. Hel1_31_208]SDS34604.1 AraC-type DNA-binding protein [Formosa sp. Hel1_31_208]
MAIFMDFHDLTDGITAAHVAEMHQADLNIEHKYNCSRLTYWCDEERKAVFCLIDAPNKEAVIALHKNAHGAVPRRIIEVNSTIVESFLGRIEDPEKSNNTELNIINDPAFRVLMVVEISNYLNRLESDQLTIFTQKFHNSTTKIIKTYTGRIVKKNNYSYLVSFQSVTDAVLCANEIQYKFKYVTPKFDPNIRRLNIALSSGIPVTDKPNIFEEAITLATRMCEISKESFVITSEVNALYESENRNASIDKDIIHVLPLKDEKFLTQLMDFIEHIWNKPDFNMSQFSTSLGYSKSQLYRKIMALTGQSPNRFLREFRLHKALQLLHSQHGNISEIAFESGFNSAAYFSSCFLNKYGILPSRYLQQHIN